VTSLDHVVFGTDWPYEDLPRSGSDPAPGLDFLGSDRPAVEHENVAELVPRWARTHG
jgi:predicted TIM-barrel fold metal-dependent hydrolase